MNAKMTYTNPDKLTISNILEQTNTIAIVGLSNKEYRTSYKIGEFLQNNNFTIIPVNPNIEESLGVKAYKSLLEIKEKIDMINIFRRSHEISKITNQTLKMKHLPKFFWMQEGIYDPTSRDELTAKGITTIQDLCIKKVYEEIF
jgi:predicted CoA-binding protein